MNKIKQKTYFNILILFAVIIAVFYIGNFYLIETVKSLSSEAISKKQKIERLNEQSDQIDDIRIGYEYMQEEMDEVSNLIVSYSNIVDFIIEIENVARESEVDLNISISNKEREYLDDNLSFVGYSVEAVGDFDSVMSFLVYLENLKYLNKVENLRMYDSSNNKKDFAKLFEVDSSEVILNASLKIYVKNEDVK